MPKIPDALYLIVERNLELCDARKPRQEELQAQFEKAREQLVKLQERAMVPDWRRL